MRWIRYSQFEEDDFGISAEDLMRALSNYFLQSGFDDPYGGYPNGEDTMEMLREAIRQALENDELIPPGEYEQLTPEQQEALIDRLADKLQTEGYVSEPPQGPGREGDAGGDVRVTTTDKALDFLGYKTLKDLLGSLGRSSFGAHDTRDLSTGIETSGSSKPYEFGDALNLDVNETLRNAMLRRGPADTGPVELEYADLHVHQSEYQSSCATVLLLDCSHSMILYGEDRFTPAKRVALALAHLIRTQYPGDSLRLVLFHDSAEEMRLGDLARVQVGPYHTNTRDGLILAQRILQQEKKDMKQIIMITDGKPSALTLDNGQIYKNPFGLDPLVIARTLDEVSRCKRQGILINTFMLATNYDLVNFVQKVTGLCRGKAYFTTPQTLGQYLLMDYMNRKTRTVH
ncbi:MAG TPA: VWA domain-containing protein [Bryobacteraceae bacterium]|nr:VWA domain-containing protein [Bryobacteraceae bacterium]